MTNVNTILTNRFGGKKNYHRNSMLVDKIVFFRLEEILISAWHNIHNVVKLDFSKSIKG